MLEFALVLPFLLFIGMLLAQTTLLMSGNLFVHYAAFAAARTAIVVIPTSVTTSNTDLTTGEPANKIDCSTQNLSEQGKLQRIRRAAVFAVLPVAGRLEGSDTDQTRTLEAGLRELYSRNGGNSPAWVSHLAAKRFRYADAHTEVRLVRTRSDAEGRMVFTELTGQHAFGPREPITVRVLHNLALTVPFVRHVFAGHTVAT
ncbi:MAG: hypothetical protein IT440_08890, partial [Phycisphaeraceae bacterium]|nr:hypothetical protein [Phycisphaeraceae bacterium]